VLATICIVFIAFSSFSITTPMIILGQKYLPANIGFASGISLGISISIGGMVAPLVGRFADIYGLLTAFQFLAFLPLVPAIVALTLKQPMVDKE